jgi:predicted CopG family antitoxin
MKKDITTITVSERTHYELYRLKRKLKKRSFDELLRYLINHYYRTYRKAE